MTDRDREVVEGWLAAERGDLPDSTATKAWREGYALKRRQLTERRRFARLHLQPAVAQ